LKLIAGESTPTEKLLAAPEPWKLPSISTPALLQYNNQPRHTFLSIVKMEPLTSAPETSSFIPLADHQSRTPSSFYSGPPVLHYHSQRCKIVVLEREVLAAPALNALRGESASANTSTQDDDEKEIAIDGVDVWVTSE
jgi:hypothetical protein